MDIGVYWCLFGWQKFELDSVPVVQIRKNNEKSLNSVLSLYVFYRTGCATECTKGSVQFEIGS